MKLLSQFFAVNRVISGYIDNLVPDWARVDGNRYFLDHILPTALSNNLIVWEVGGGSQPYLSRAQKLSMNITVLGLDLSQDELDKAPFGAYDQTYAVDICSYSGDENADLVICQATLEHVWDTAAALRAISTILRPGGTAYIFVPCRNALYARLNLLLPEKIKNYLLSAISPHLLEHQGFPAFYNDCIPSKIKTHAKASNMTVLRTQHFWKSNYFDNLVPAYVFWRLWQVILYLILRSDAAETFVMVLQKNEGKQRSS
jgi:SAM-dependent methyltransferase